MTKPFKHATAGVFILTNSQPVKALLMHHKKLGQWMQPGGHQETWENPLEAAIREAMEETGINVAPYLGALESIDSGAALIPPPAYLLEERIAAHGQEPQHYHLDSIYVVRLPEQAITQNVQESHDIGWFTVEEVQTIATFENVRKLLLQEMTK